MMMADTRLVVAAWVIMLASAAGCSPDFIAAPCGRAVELGKCTGGPYARCAVLLDTGKVVRAANPVMIGECVCLIKGRVSGSRWLPRPGMCSDLRGRGDG